MKCLVVRTILLTSVAILSSACSGNSSLWQEAGPWEQDAERVIEVQENPLAGTVSSPWVEPMYDDIRIPGQVDASGTYYRLPHRSVVEIRPGRVQVRQFPPNRPQEQYRGKVLLPEGR